MMMCFMSCLFSSTRQARALIAHPHGDRNKHPLGFQQGAEAQEQANEQIHDVPQLCAMKMVPSTMKPMPAIRAALMSSLKTK